MAWLLFGIYQIGHHVEDPFNGSLRLSILCEAIRKDLLSEDDSAFHHDDDNDTVLRNIKAELDEAAAMDDGHDDDVSAMTS